MSSAGTAPGVSFGVTVASTDVALDADRRGQAGFTVTNRTDQPRQGRARTVVQGSTDSSWLTLEGDAERAFSPGSTQLFVVDIAVPAAAPPGAYSFRLDVLAVANPDEDYTEGPTVTFVVGVEKPKPPPTRKYGYLATVVGALVGTVVGAAIGLVPGALFALIAVITSRHAPGVRTVITVLGIGGLVGAWGGAAAGGWMALRLSAYTGVEATAGLVLAFLFLPMIAMLIFLLVAGTSANALVIAAVMLVAAGGLGAAARYVVVTRLKP
jgi:hypothetical protein